MVLEVIRGGKTQGSPRAVRVLFNLTDRRQPMTESPGALVVWTSESERYDGMRRSETPPTELLPDECMVFDSNPQNTPGQRILSEKRTSH